MSEQLSNLEPLELIQFDELVAETRRWNERVADDGWEQRYADLIRDETVEFLVQHGNTSALLLPDEFGTAFESTEETILGAVDELSDMLWFGFDTALRLNYSGSEVCNAVLQKRFGAQASTFADTQHLITKHARNFCVPNKLAVVYGITGDLSETSLEQNPLYVFMRVSNRLCQALNPEQVTSGPPTTSDFESAMDRIETCGDFLLCLLYIASNRLGWETEDVALYNFQKLQERDRWGKLSSLDS